MSKSDALTPVVDFDDATAPPLALPVAPPSVRTTAAAALPPAAAGDARKAGRTAPAGDENGDALPALASVQDFLREAPAWLFSGIIHMLLIIILGLFLVAQQKNSEFLLSLSAVDDGGEDLQAREDDVPFDLDEPPLTPGDSLEPLQMAADELTEDFAASQSAPIAPLGVTVDPDASPIEMALTGREAGMKQSLLRAYGGTSSTERAVTEALRWLVRNQQSSGMWSLSGSYSDGALPDNPDAATAMALLAFQGAGYTPERDRNDPFTPVVSRGWTALLKRQDKDGNFFQEGSSHGRLYTQALCTIALCELYGMTTDSRYRDPAQKALDYCLAVQSPEGGWRYQPGYDADMSVTGWFVMALQSARMAGLDVPTESLRRVGKFLDTVALEGGSSYGYTPGQGKRLSMTAEGLLCRQYLGWSRTDPRLRRGIKELLENVPEDVDGQREAYYWYYATQVCHHVEGPAWRHWNRAMRTAVPAMQVRDGRERGSWNPDEDAGIGVSGGGRLFVTCLYTYMLEVYYRHLPLYQLGALQMAR